jgi:hypothetical protein
VRIRRFAAVTLAAGDVQTRFLIQAAPKKVYLSPHGTCDHARARMQQELKAETQVLKAGATYRF